jgi:hypothetical protein
MDDTSTVSENTAMRNKPAKKSSFHETQQLDNFDFYEFVPKRYESTSHKIDEDKDITPGAVTHLYNRWLQLIDERRGPVDIAEL